MIFTRKLAGKLQFNLAHQLKRTKNVYNGSEMRKTEVEVLLCKKYKKIRNRW